MILHAVDALEAYHGFRFNTSAGVKVQRDNVL